MISRKLFTILFFVSVSTLQAQTEINNLVHTSNYVTAPLGAIDVKVFGTGAKKAILLPGWGFDASVFRDFVSAHDKEFTMYAITFPGFGNTHAPPMPDPPVKYKELTWTKGIIKGIVELMEKEKMSEVVLVSYFTFSNLVAMRLALDYPAKISKVITVSGMAKFTAQYPSFEPRNLEQRIRYVEEGLAPQWFKTVTKQTWDNGNFAPATFTKDSIKAKKVWEQMSAVPVPVMVRYLCEYYCTDITLEYSNLKVPTLVVIPSFTPEVLSKYGYLGPFFHGSWIGARPGNNLISVVTITDTNAFIIEDQPAKLNLLIKDFLGGTLKPFDPMR